MKSIIAVALATGFFLSALPIQPAAAQGGASDTRNRARRAPDAALDRGPFTPEANRAYQGGGVILQGAPGAPAPTPEATPPGQMPRNMVPPR